MEKMIDVSDKYTDEKTREVIDSPISNNTVAKKNSENTSKKEKITSPEEAHETALAYSEKNK